MKDQNSWWREGALCIAEGFTSLWELYSIPEEQIESIVEKYAKTGANTVHFGAIQVGEGCGTDHEKPIFSMHGRDSQDPETLPIFLEAFHRHGIRVVIYFNGHSFVPKFAKDHPDWMQVYENGERALDIYGTGASACPNREAFTDWQANVIRDLCKYEIDGVFLDGDIFFAGTCYCDACKDKFQATYGFEMPSKKDRANPQWRYVREFQIDSLTAYVGKMYDALKSIKPEALLYCNAGLRTANWATGRQNRRLMDVQDMLLAEGGFLYGNLLDTPIWRTECEDKLCVTQSGGKPVVSGMAADHKSWNHYQLPEGEYKRMMFAALATGAHIYAGMSSPVNKIDALISSFHDIYAFVHKNEATLYPTESKAKTAIVWSNVNADYYPGGSIRTTDFTQAASFTNIGDLHQEFEGFYEVCFRNGILTDVIDEISLIDGSIDQYDMLILPNIACMSKAETDAVTRFVKEGGTLIASFETSLFDEYGQPNPSFDLEPLFGVRQTVPQSFGPLRFDYVMPVHDAKDMKSIRDYTYLPTPSYVKKTVPTGAKRVMDLANLLKGSYDGKPDRSENGFWYEHEVGKGRCIYFAGTIGQLLGQWRFGEYTDSVGGLLKRYSNQHVQLCNAPSSVGINVRENRNTKERLIYLTNYTGAMTRPVRETVPVCDVCVKLDFPIRSCRALINQDALHQSRQDGQVVLTLSTLDEFEVIVLTL